MSFHVFFSLYIDISRYLVYCQYTMLTPYQRKQLFESRKHQSEKRFSNEKPVKPILQIYEALSHGEQTKRSGRATLICCPFHGEDNPSCALYEDTNSYFCFACKEAGDYITLVMKMANVDFKEALSIIERI